MCVYVCQSNLDTIIAKINKRVPTHAKSLCNKIQCRESVLFVLSQMYKQKRFVNSRMDFHRFCAEFLLFFHISRRLRFYWIIQD